MRIESHPEIEDEMGTESVRRPRWVRAPAAFAALPSFPLLQREPLPFHDPASAASPASVSSSPPNLPRSLHISRSRRLWSLLSRRGVRVCSHSLSAEHPLAQFFTSSSSSCCYFFLQLPSPCSPVPLPSSPPCRGSDLRHRLVVGASAWGVGALNRFFSVE